MGTMQLLGLVFVIAGIGFMFLGKTASRLVRILGVVLVVQGALFLFLPLLTNSSP